jgi:hypothetical protein
MLEPDPKGGWPGERHYNTATCEVVSVRNASRRMMLCRRTGEISERVPAALRQRNQLLDFLFWDSGFHVRLGDDVTGFVSETRVENRGRDRAVASSRSNAALP